ncbi:hypothetical protein CR513_48297, partial [Mucuna pruriens]
MGCIKRERQVLKLVHPGRRVEVHKEPITAAEVMRRNPRHCIARPNVFEFPFVVVKPESVLLPGNVYFIVPNHTLYDLLKAKGQSNHSPLMQNQPPNNRLISSYAWVSSKFQTYKQHIKCLFTRKGNVGESRKVKEKLHVFNKVFLPLFFHTPFSRRGSNCQSNTNVESLCKYEGDDGRSQNQSQVEDTHTPYDAIENQKNNKDIEMELPKKDVLGHNEQVSEVTMLKSCLTRPDSIRKSLNLKVSFDIPNKKQEQQITLNMFRSKFFGYLSW